MSCEWPVDRTCLPDLPTLGATPTPDEQAAYDALVDSRNQNENIAIAVLFALTGRQFMCQEMYERPQPTSNPGVCDDGPLIEAYYRNDYRGVPGFAGSPTVVKLNGPVQEILAVTIDGTLVDESEYVLENDSLYRLNGRWPYNNMNVPSGYPGSWSVHYVQGRQPPEFVGKYVGRLASEMIVACEDAKRCKLPRTVISTSRNGVTHVFDPTRMLAAGFTGIPEIDTWIAAVNPNNLASSARIR